MTQESESFLCPECGNPWNLFTLEIEAKDTGREIFHVISDFMDRGCPAIRAPHRESP